MSSLYVTNLSHMTREDELRRLCGAFGAVRTAHVLHHLKTGIGCASGLVEMESAAGAREAIAHLHEREYRGRRLIVCPATAAQTGSFGRLRGPITTSTSPTSACEVFTGPESGGFGDRGGDRPRGGRLFVFAESDRPIRST